MTTSQIHECFLISSGICTDTRDIKKGCIFFALKGGNFNGNDFALQALVLGASFVVVDEAHEPCKGLILVDDVLSCLQALANYHRNQLNCPVLAVVGSNGKTTTKELLQVVLANKFKVCATKGNLNNHIGVPLTLLSADLDVEFVLVEMGANHQKEITFLCGIAEPDCGLITNIGLAHLEGFGGVEGVRAGKTELYHYLNTRDKLVFFNHDEPSIAEFGDTLKNKVSYGSGSDVIVKETGSENDFLFLDVEIPQAAHHIQTMLFGGYNVNNVLTAVAVGNYFGLSIEAIVGGIESYEPDNNRSQVKQTVRGNSVVMDAYNANPTSMAHAINNFSAINSDKCVYVLGDMLELGDQSFDEHLKLLKVLCPLPGVKYLVGKEFGKHKWYFEHNEKLIFFAEVNELVIALTHARIVNSRVLIKGSRGIALEQAEVEL